MATVDIRSAQSDAARAREGASGPPRVLVVEGLCRDFGTRRVIYGFDLTVSAGERVALRGRNGSGKTTILRCILGNTLAVARPHLGRGTRGSGPSPLAASSAL